MIVSSKPDSYDGSWRIVLYEVDKNGRCEAQLTKPELDDQIPSYYVQRDLELKRLEQALTAGEISPIGFFMQYHSMDIKDLAARMRLSRGAVKKHLTPKGFARVKVEALQRYARIFDIAVSDFFQFTYVPEALGVEQSRHLERLLLKVTISDKS